jgi:hypothetical protein
MTKLFQVIGWILLFLYCIAVFEAVDYTTFVAGAPKPDLMPGWLSLIASSVNGLLVTHFIAFCGLNVVLAGLRAPPPIHSLQIAGVVAYVVAVVAAVVTWATTGFTGDATQIVAVLPQIAQGGIAIMIAILAAGLGVKLQVQRFLIEHQTPPELRKTST